MDRPERPDPFHKGKVKKNRYNHVEVLSVKIGDRHLWKGNSLDRTLKHIESAFTVSGYAAELQSYSSYGRTFPNLIAEKKGESKELVGVGAHYDSVPVAPSADDNASARRIWDAWSMRST